MSWSYLPQFVSIVLTQLLSYIVTSCCHLLKSWRMLSQFPLPLCQLPPASEYTHCKQKLCIWIYWWDVPFLCTCTVFWPICQKLGENINFCPCSTLKKNLFTYPVLISQSVCWKPCLYDHPFCHVFKSWHDGSYLATFQISFLSPTKPICWYNFKSVIKFCLSLSSIKNK